MFSKKTTYFAFLLLILVLLAACAPVQQATPVAELQIPQGAVETSVAATLSVLENQVASMVEATLQSLPTNEPVATATQIFTATTEPTPTTAPVQITEVPTFSPIPPTATRSSVVRQPTVAQEYACAVFSQKPKDYVIMSPRQEFDMKWTLLNTGTKTWTDHSTDYKHVRGELMHQHASVYNINKHVGPGGKLEITIDMVAPKEKGTHVTYWGLANGSQHFCQFYIIVVVQ